MLQRVDRLLISSIECLAFLVNTNTIKKNYFLFPKNKRGWLRKSSFFGIGGSQLGPAFVGEAL